MVTRDKTMNENKNETKREKPRFKMIPIIAGSAILGLAASFGVFALIPSNATSLITAGISQEEDGKINKIDVPNAEEIKIGDGEKDTTNNANEITIEGGEDPYALQRSGENAGTGVGTSTGGNSSGSTGGGYSPPSSGGSESSQPVNTAYCPSSRGENPALYDSCRAGYVAPTIVGSITSCYPIDKAAGAWSVTVSWSANGGNWRGHWNGGSSRTMTHYTSPGEATSGELLMVGASASLTITDMNGWGWKIDEVYGSFPGVPMNSVCS